MRHLAVKNYALEDTDGKLTRVSVLPEARQTVASEPMPSADEALQIPGQAPHATAGAVEVQGIVDHSQAQEVGLRKGDIILEYAGTQITRAAELVVESKKRTTEEDIELLVLREGQQVHVNVKGGFIGIRIKTVNMPPGPDR
jgi:S1-C subfamily serine protease